MDEKEKEEDDCNKDSSLEVCFVHLQSIQTCQFVETKVHLFQVGLNEQEKEGEGEEKRNMRTRRREKVEEKNKVHVHVYITPSQMVYTCTMWARPSAVVSSLRERERDERRERELPTRNLVSLLPDRLRVWGETSNGILCMAGRVSMVTVICCRLCWPDNCNKTASSSSTSLKVRRRRRRRERAKRNVGRSCLLWSLGGTRGRGNDVLIISCYVSLLLLLHW